MDVSLNRFNKVIVNNSTTDEYFVQDGIDQGEIQFPILWRIFYDTLLTRLEEIKEEVGYNKVEATKIIDIVKGMSEKRSITFNVSAFIDDKTLIGKNRKSMDRMVKICHKFFKINDIKTT